MARKSLARCSEHRDRTATHAVNLKAHDRQVVTWQAPSGETLDVCVACEYRMTRAKTWPRTDQGAEFCSVSRGRHRGECEIFAEVVS